MLLLTQVLYPHYCTLPHPGCLVLKGNREKTGFKSPSWPRRACKVWLQEGTPFFGMKIRDKMPLLHHLAIKSPLSIYGSFRWISWKWLQRLKNTKTANVYVHALTAGGHRNIWKSSRHQGISWGCSALHVVFYFILILKTFLLFNLFLCVVRNCLIHFKLF